MERLLHITVCAALIAAVDAHLAGGNATGEALPTARIICTSNWVPMATCQKDKSPNSYSGYDPEVFRSAAYLLGWVEGVNFTWACMDWEEMMADVASPNGRCWAAAAGITITSDRIKAGIKFSYPTYHSSLAVLVKNPGTTQSGSSGFSFITSPLSWQVWLALGVTVLLFPLAAFFIEFLSVKGHIQRNEYLRGYKESVIRGMWTVMIFEPFHLSSLGARVAALCFGFLATILINSYCANLAASLTVSSLSNQIHHVSDLRGRAVGTDSAYLRPLRTLYGIHAVDGYGNFTAFADAVDSGQLTAYITDEPIVHYAYHTRKGCPLTHLGELIMPFDYGFAFPNRTDAEAIDQFSDAIIKLMGSGMLAHLRMSALIMELGCHVLPRAAGVVEITPITFSQIYGLWVILGAGTAFGMLCMLFSMWMRHYLQARILHAKMLRSTVSGDCQKGGSSSDCGSLPEHAEQLKRFSETPSPELL